MHHFISRRALLACGLAFAAFPKAFAQAAKRPIGIIGSGNIGGTIGALWVKAGHPVMFSSRSPESLKAMAARLGPLAKTGTVAQAIAFSDVLFLAVPYMAIPGIGRDHGAALKGKIVLDSCNSKVERDGAPLTKEVESNGVGVTTQKYLPGTKIVRAFNSLGAGIFGREANRADPKLPVPIAGDDAEAVRVAEMLVRDAGFEPVLAGKLADAQKFYWGGPGNGVFKSAAELKAKLGLGRGSP